MSNDLGFLFGFGGLVPGGSVEDAYREWMELQELEGLSDKIPGTAAPVLGFKMWLVIRVPAKNFSEAVEHDESLGMYVPRKGFGEFWGIATTLPELEKLVGAKYKTSRGLEDEPVPKGKTYQVKSDYVYLTYKIRIKTEDQWAPLLEFLGHNRMIEADKE